MRERVRVRERERKTQKYENDEIFEKIRAKIAL